jgi:hypothetical protein
MKDKLRYLGSCPGRPMKRTSVFEGLSERRFFSIFKSGMIMITVSSNTQKFEIFSDMRTLPEFFQCDNEFVEVQTDMRADSILRRRRAGVLASAAAHAAVALSIQAAARRRHQ